MLLVTAPAIATDSWVDVVLFAATHQPLVAHRHIPEFAAGGHGRYRCSVGFADPAHGLAVAVVFNGMPTDAAHDARMRAVLDALYVDLGLAAPRLIKPHPLPLPLPLPLP